MLLPPPIMTHTMIGVASAPLRERLYIFALKLEGTGGARAGPPRPQAQIAPRPLPPGPGARAAGQAPLNGLFRQREAVVNSGLYCLGAAVHPSGSGRGGDGGGPGVTVRRHWHHHGTRGAPRQDDSEVQDARGRGRCTPHTHTTRLNTQRQKGRDSPSGIGRKFSNILVVLEQVPSNCSGRPSLLNG